MENNQLRAIGRQAFKANYWRCVLVALILGLLTAATTGASNSSATGDSGMDFSQLTNPQIASITIALVIVIIVAVLLRIFVWNPLEVGCYRFFQHNVYDNGPERPGLGYLKEGFGNYGHVFGTLFLRDLFIFLWSILFIIPGIVMNYAYWLVPYLIKDNPELSATQAIQRSKRMMKGYKGKAFLLDLSFIGWALLSAITFGIVGVFWTNPYYYNTKAAFYLDLKNR